MGSAAAWCFSADGRQFDVALSEALLDGYQTEQALSDQEMRAFKVLARGACLRFLASRAYDWLNTPADALVMRKDPMAFARRIALYAEPAREFAGLLR